jgi:hypothetical protein
LSGIVVTLSPTLYPIFSAPANIVDVDVVDRIGVVSTTGSAFNGGGMSEGSFSIISVQTALLCHLRRRVNYHQYQLAYKPK